MRGSRRRRGPASAFADLFRGRRVSDAHRARGLTLRAQRKSYLGLVCRVDDAQRRPPSTRPAGGLIPRPRASLSSGVPASPAICGEEHRGGESLQRVLLAGQTSAREQPDQPAVLAELGVIGDTRRIARLRRGKASYGAEGRRREGNRRA